jgi:hypothetical protein
MVGDTCRTDFVALNDGVIMGIMVDIRDLQLNVGSEPLDRSWYPSQFQSSVLVEVMVSVCEQKSLLTGLTGDRILNKTTRPPIVPEVVPQVR